MALGLSADAEIRNGGSDGNSGWFDSALGGTDYTLQTAAQVTFAGTLSGSGATTLTDSANSFTSPHVGNTVRITGLAIAGTFSATNTTTLTCSASNFTAAMVGMVVSVSSGLYRIVSQAGTTAVVDRALGTFSGLSATLQGLYEIAAYVGAGSVTVDKNLPTFTGASGALGGALATKGQAGQDMACCGVAGNGVFVKYSVTAFTDTNILSNVSGGSFQPPFAGAYNRMGHLTGYDTTRTRGNKDANRPTLKAGIASVSLTKMADNTIYENLILDGNAASFTGAAGISSGFGFRSRVVNCLLKNFGSYAIQIATGTVEDCEFTANAFYSVYAGLTVAIIRCEFHGNTYTSLGFSSNSTATLVDCHFYSNTGAAVNGIDAGQSGFVNIIVTVINCNFVNNGLHGVFLSAAANGWNNALKLENCIFVSNGGYGVSVTNNQDNVYVVNCAFYNNTSGDINSNVNAANISSKITLTGDPFVSASTGNFALNNTAGAGAACRGAGLPGAFPRGTTTGKRDVGAAQSGATGGIIPVGMNGGIRG